MNNYLFGAGALIVVGSHVYMLEYPMDCPVVQRKHAMLNLVAVGMMLYSVA